MRKTEVNYFIFVATDIEKGRLSTPSGYQVARSCAQQHLWGMGPRTPNRQVLKIGDHILMYVAGSREHRQSFVGTAMVSAEPSEAMLTISGKVWNWRVGIKNAKFFTHPVPITPIRKNLDFIKQPDSIKWGNCFQGGIVRISKKDFDLVTLSAKTMPKIEKAAQ